MGMGIQVLSCSCKTKILMAALIALQVQSMPVDDDEGRRSSDRESQAWFWTMAVMFLVMREMYTHVRDAFPEAEAEPVESEEDWDFVNVEPDPEPKAKAKAKAEPQPKAKPKAKANAKADPNVRMYPDEVVTEVYYDETMTQIGRQTIHSNRWCGEMQKENARRLRYCKWCQSRGQLYHGRPCAGSKVYFTPFGTCYHTSTRCRGLDQRNAAYNVIDAFGCSECMMVPYDEL